MKKKVCVGLSGGVDSSVSAYLLKKAGYDVTGVFIKVWQPDFVPCTWREDRLDAMRVCAVLDIPFRTLDLENVYKREVVDYLISEYRAGRTPNPDVFCNKEVKFGAFLKWALKQGAGYVATGHYAQIKPTTNNQQITINSPSELSVVSCKLHCGIDAAKDQSYFLWTLTQEQLKHILFPVGHLKKTEVRKIAKKVGLPTAGKKDSQGLCFISNLNMKDFLKHFISAREGDVLSEDGRVIGKHDGAHLYTLGERHGFQVNKKNSSSSPFYVVSKDIKNNTITVSTKPIVNNQQLTTYNLKNINWISPPKRSDLPLGRSDLFAQTHYHGELHPCQILSPQSEKSGHPMSRFLPKLAAETAVQFKKPVLVSPGQSVVFYKKNECLGGSIIV